MKFAWHWTVTICVAVFVGVAGGFAVGMYLNGVS